MRFLPEMDVVMKTFGFMIICFEVMRVSSDAATILDDEIGKLIDEFETYGSNEIISFDFTDFESRAANIKSKIDYYHDSARALSAKCNSKEASHASKIRLQTFEYLLRNAREMYAFRRISDYDPEDIIFFLSRYLSYLEEKDFNYAEVLRHLQNVHALINSSTTLLQDSIREGIMIDEGSLNRLQQRTCNQSQIERDIDGWTNSSRIFKTDPIQLQLAETNNTGKLLKESKEMIESLVQAYVKFTDFICKEYVYAKAVRSSVSLSAVPNGSEYYAALARVSTTTTLTPEEIHDIGRREMERIKAEMDKIKIKEGFNGTLDQFFEHIQSQKQFYFDDEEELKEAFINTMDEAGKSRGVVLKQYTEEARLRFVSWADFPFAFFSDRVVVNTFNFDEMLRSEVLVVSLHEGSPGHHSQGIYPRDIESIRLPSLDFWPAPWPAFSGYIEGWGLYSEALGEDMGLYKTNMQRFVRYSYELLRSVRLVIDTGVHHYGWTLEEAADFVRQHTLLPEDRANVEAGRAKKWPAQMLSYKIGEMKITALRRQAEAHMGDNFDLREFNHQILRIGEVPLEVLEEHINHWLLHMTNASTQPAASSRLALLLITIIVAAVGC